MIFKVLLLLLLLCFDIFANDLVIYVNAPLGEEYSQIRWQPTIDLLNKKIPEFHFKLLSISPEKISSIKKLLQEEKIDFLITQPVITTELIYTHGISQMLSLADKKHLDRYGSVIFTRKDNKMINSINDIKGKTIVSTTPYSLGSWLGAYNEIFDNGIDPLKDKKVTFTKEGQQKVIQYVLSSKYDVGIVRTGMLEKLDEKNIIDIEQFKIINKQNTKYDFASSTKLYPGWSLSRAQHVDIHVANKVFKVLNDIKSKDKEAIVGEYYHWHLPVNHKEIEGIFKKFSLGHYKNLPKYDVGHMVIVVTLVSIILSMIFFIITLYMKYKYDQITKKKLEAEVEEKIKKISDLNKRFFYAADEALAGYWEWNYETNYLFLSQGWTRFLGYEKNELKNHYDTFKNLIHPDDIKPTMKVVNDLIEHKIDVYKTKFRLKHKNGKYKWVNAVGKLAQDSEDKKIFFGFHIDIDEFVTTKEMLIAQSKSATMGEMISLIVHQWKQPLSVLSMIGNNIKMDILLNSIDKDSLNKEADNINVQVRYLSDTITTFRNFLQPHHENTWCDMEEIVHNSLVIISKSLSNNNIELVKEIEKNLQPVNLNSSEFIQIMINLIANAKDAFVINNIEKRKIWIRAYSKNEHIHVEIEDTAGGIPEDKIDKIFNAYFTTKGKNGGTGLGLYIVKTIVEEHFNGFISVENTKSGARFIIRL